MKSKVVLVGGGQPTVDLDTLATVDDISGLMVKGQIDIGTAPASAGATGVAGTFVVAVDGIYLCTATDTWVKVALATWGG